VRTHAASIPLRRAPPPGAAAGAPRSLSAVVLGLQRAAGNRATRALLRDTAAHPAKLDKPRADLPALGTGGLDQAAWSKKVAAAREALAGGDRDTAVKLYTELYRDLAASAGADKLRDVGKDMRVNLAKADDTGYAPGLNLILGGGAAKGGTTGFVDAAGKFGVPFDAKGKRPGIAIRLFASSFTDDKLTALGTLRHEMLHVHHREQALAALDGSKPQSAVDKAIVKEIQSNLKASTELLAYVEGFMTVFHRIDPAPDPKHPVFVELLGMLETTTVDPWRYADKDVRDEALGRLREYYCDTLDDAHRAAFDAFVAAQAAQVDKDAEALKSGRKDGSVATAKNHQARMFEHFVRGLQEVVAKCPTGRRR
jgi:hypothetical protein